MFAGQDSMKIPGYTGHQRGVEVVDERPNGPAQKKIPGKLKLGETKFLITAPYAIIDASLSLFL